MSTENSAAENLSSWNRRNFLRAGAIATSAFFIPHSLRWARGEEKHHEKDNHVSKTLRIPVALQLYSIGDAAKKDLPAALAHIAKIGYDGVEFAGYYGLAPKEIRKMIDDNSLLAAGTHTGIGELRKDFQKQVDIHHELGAKFMIVPAMPAAEVQNLEINARIADEFSQFAEKAKIAGLQFGYHAHAADAKDIDGISAWSRIFTKGSKDLVAQMDVGNFVAGGGDPYAEIARFPGQAKTVHLKDHGNGQNRPPVGSGVVDWQRVFEVCENHGGTEWYVVEYENANSEDYTPIESSFAYLKKCGKTK